MIMSIKEQKDSCTMIVAITLISNISHDVDLLNLFLINRTECFQGVFGEIIMLTNETMDA